MELTYKQKMIDTMKPKTKRKRVMMFTFRYKIDRPYYNPFFGKMKAKDYDDAREKLKAAFPNYTIVMLQQTNDKKNQ